MAIANQTSNELKTMNLESIAKFTIVNSAQRLAGGQNESLRVGNLVLKQVYEAEKYIWLGTSLNQIDFRDLQVAVPVKSRQGNFVEDNIGATEYFEAQFFSDRLGQKLKACRKLNSIISNISKPSGFDSWENPWTKAQGIAWSQSTSSDLEIPAEIKSLLNMRSRLEMPNQLVHVDLAGNILFDKNENPVVIDFTPGFYPKEYAEVLLLVDSIAWYNASIDSLKLSDLPQDLKKQLVLRALIFRLSVPLFMEKSVTAKDFQANYDGYRSVVEQFLLVRDL